MRQRYGLHKRVIKEKKESNYHRLQRRWNRPTTLFSTREFKAGILVLLGLAVFFIPINAYYQNNILGHLITTSNKDPFTTLWNGQISNTYSTTSGSSGSIAFNNKVNATCAISCGGSPIDTVLVFPSLTTGTGDTIIIEFWANHGISAKFIITDSSLNLYTPRLNVTTLGPDVYIASAPSSTSGSDVITLKSTAQNAFAGVVSDYTGAIGFGNTASSTGTSGVGISSGTSNITITSSATSSFILEFMAIGTSTACGPANTGRVLPASSQTLRNEYAAPNCSYVTSGTTDKTGISGSNTLVLSWTTLGDSNSWSHGGLELTNSITSAKTCGQVGYQCSNMKIVNGLLQSQANSTFPAIALSNSSISLANSAGKALAFYFSISLLTPIVGEEFAWFLRANATLPNRSGDIGYSPTNDTSVALAVVLSITSNKFNYYVYMQRPSGVIQKFWSGTENPIIPSSCSNSIQLFLCATNSTTADRGFPLMALVLNYTGSANGGTGAGQSYLCNDFGGGSTQCNLGGANNVAIGITNTNFRLNYTEPWLNLQNNYYVGWWQKAQVNNIFSVQFATAKNSGPASAQIISIYSPSSTNSNVAEGGFFGWLKNAFISSTCTSLKALTLFLADPCTSLSNAPQDMATALATGLVFVFTTLATGFRTLLNGFGNLVGDGNIGDNIFSFFANMSGYFTTVFSIAIAQFGNELTIFIAELNAVINFISLTNMFTILSGFMTNFGLWIALFNTPFGDILFLVGNLTYFAALVFILWYFYIGFTIFWSGAEAGINAIKESASTITSIFKLFFDTGLTVIDMALRVKGLIARWL